MTAGEKRLVNKLLFSSPLSVFITHHLIPRRDQFAVQNCSHHLKTKNNNCEMQKPSSTRIQVLAVAMAFVSFVSAFDGGTAVISRILRSVDYSK